MPTRISHIPFYSRLHIPDWWLYAAGGAYVIPLVLLLWWKPMLAVVFAAAPAVMFLAAHGPGAIYLLIAATFIFAPMQGPVALLPADMAAFILIAAYVVDLLCRGRVTYGNRLLMPFFLYLIAALVSIAAEGFTGMSVRYFLRLTVLFFTFMAVAHFGRRVRITTVFGVFMAAALGNSLFALLQFLQAGGAIRAFGAAGHGFGDHAMIAFLISTVYYLWTRDLRAKIFWGIAALVTVAALAATQTRAAAITAGWAFLLVVYLSIRISRRTGLDMPRRNLIAAGVIGLIVIPLLAAYTPVFEGIIYRFGRIGPNASGTILLRFSLWKAALSAFWANPVLGIGAGNFPMVINWIPNVRFDPIFYMVTGLTTHAIVLTALAETGLLGFFTMGLFMVRAVKKSFRDLTASVAESDIAAALCLFIVALAVLGSSLYAGAWFWGNNSYHMAVFFGLIAAYRPQGKPLIVRGAQA